MIRCLIKVGALSYVGIFPSTCLAQDDALQRFPGARGISARAVQ